jgi:hypothetical protein
MLVTYWPVVARIGLISLLKQSHYIANLPYFRYFCFLLRGNKYPCLKLFVVLLRKIRVLLVPSAKFMDFMKAFDKVPHTAIEGS